jgi:hypothetical protein
MSVRSVERVYLSAMVPRNYHGALHDRSLARRASSPGCASWDEVGRLSLDTSGGRPGRRAKR